ncbi:hypothetical protein [Mesorhizobium sp.]|uniref:hypothetical protein n=1 Tax=Mesorhizobium sp. TaxID=1871066 RepID=UPI00121492F8|nr:hypothetical protein [Mesorhizobium sp.]TIN84327.1 MAG: hypothetical protein E5X97_22400 [Mesorhizobium sp.]
MNQHNHAVTAAAMRRDINQLGLHDIMEIVKGCKHWPAIADEVIYEAIKAGDVVAKRDVEDASREADGKIRSLEGDLVDAETEVDKLKARLELFAGDLDRLQELIVSRQIDDALHLLRELAPEHQFLSPAAEAMLAGQRGLL